jgi:hypothetical protein
VQHPQRALHLLRSLIAEAGFLAFHLSLTERPYPLSCGGFVEDAMLIYINEEHEIIIYGRCGCCNQFGGKR